MIKRVKVGDRTSCHKFLLDRISFRTSLCFLSFLEYYWIGYVMTISVAKTEDKAGMRTIVSLMNFT